MNYKNRIAQLIKRYVELEIDAIENLIGVPPKPEMGDYTFPCFQLSKNIKKAPNIIAEELKNSIIDREFKKIENLGPYLNFFVDKGMFAQNTIQKVLKEKDNYGQSNIGEGKTICIEYSSPDIAKPFQIGHLLSTVVGNALCRMFKKEGYSVVGVNHLGDWGLRFGKLITAYRRWGNEKALEKAPIDELLRIYIKFHEEAEKDPILEDEARENFKALETGDEETLAIWAKFRRLSLMEFERIYNLLGVTFDSIAGEAFFHDKIKVVVDELREKGLLVESNSAKVVRLKEYNMPPYIVLKEEETSIYASRDLAAAIYRKKTYEFYKCIYVVEATQELRFKQIFKVLEFAGHEWARDCIHVGLGLVKFADRRFFVRNGSAISFDDLFKEAIKKTMEVINEKNLKLKNKKEAANKIGVGAVVFACFKDSREKDIVFDWKEILSFHGETGPYVQYSYERGKSLLIEGVNCTVNADYGKLASKEEFELVKSIASFNHIINLALEKLEPSIVAKYVIEVAKGLNKFYNVHPVLNLEDEDLKVARLNLVKASLQVIKNGLELLGIEVVEKM